MSKIKIFQKLSITKKDLLNLEWHPVKYVWNQAETEINSYFKLACDQSFLYFIAKSHTKANYFNEHPNSTFQKDLWKKDVAEIFLWNENKNYYQEFNLAPNACWWTQTFKTYRQEAPCKINVNSIIAKSHLDLNYWEAELIIPLTEVKINLINSYANISFIQGSPPQNFLTYSKPIKASPDFHDPNLTSKVELIVI